MSWLADALACCELTPEVESYLLSRGAKEETIVAEGIVTWSPTTDPVADPVFCKRYGDNGENLKGMLVCPIRSPKGQLIGFEGRSIHKKYITDYRLPEEAWNPFWIGTRRAVEKLWAGGDLWIVEGLFDLLPLEWALSPSATVLASVRAHLSHAHVEFLRRFCRGWVNMCYDRDETGIKATHGWIDKQGKKRWGAIERLQRVGLKCRDTPAYSGGKDPGEIWDRGGKAAIVSTFSVPV